MLTSALCLLAGCTTRQVTPAVPPPLPVAVLVAPPAAAAPESPPELVPPVPVPEPGFGPKPDSSSQGTTFHLETDGETALSSDWLPLVTGVQQAVTELCPGPGLGDVRIVLYPRRSRYEAIVPPACGAAATSLAFTDLARRTIHLCLDGVTPAKIAAILLHESTHAFVHVQTAITVPVAWQERMQSGTLPSQPLWLQEGLAAYMEPAQVSVDGWHNRGFNLSRWRELDRLIRAGTCPALAPVLAAPPGAYMDSAGYAVAWGVVYALRTGLMEASADREAGEARFRKYIAACRAAGAGDCPVVFRGLPEAANGMSTEVLRQAWDARFARFSPFLFEQLFLGPGQSLAEWEREWQARMSRLWRVGDGIP